MSYYKQPPPTAPDWLVQVPLRDLLELQSLIPQVEQLRLENKALVQRIEGLHRALYDTIEVIGDIRKNLRVVPTRAPA